ncbi:MAG: PD-(D/E)XK nuclease family protein [Acidimicrobiales bacterium]
MDDHTPAGSPPDLPVTGAGELSPAQLRVLDDLMARGQDRPRFAPEVAEALRHEIEAALGPLVHDRLPDEALWVTKGALGQVHACEAHHQAADGQPFAWNAGNARGTVAHRALELTLSSPDSAPPMELVDRALAGLGADDPRGVLRPWLASASAADVADLRAGANDLVAKFVECWPPLKPSWSPRTETRIGADLCGGRVVLRGKVDLVLGRARGSQARVLVVDLKSGRAYGSHLDDLRFYALVQALRVGVPPFRVASYYLDTATFHHEDVTEDTLAIATRRVIDGARKLVELGGGRPPTVTPGPQCGWCPLADGCDAAAARREAVGADS